jgi:hypothetical protein
LQFVCRERCRVLSQIIAERTAADEATDLQFFSEAVDSVLVRRVTENANNFVDAQFLQAAWPQELDNVRLLIIFRNRIGTLSTHNWNLFTPRADAQASIEGGQEWTGRDVILNLEDGHFTILRHQDPNNHHPIQDLLDKMLDADVAIKHPGERKFLHLESTLRGEPDRTRCMSVAQLHAQQLALPELSFASESVEEVVQDWSSVAAIDAVYGSIKQIDAAGIDWDEEYKAPCSLESAPVDLMHRQQPQQQLSLDQRRAQVQGEVLKGEGQRAAAVAGVGIPTHDLIQKVETAAVSPDDGSTSSLFGLQLIIRRQRFDSCPSVSEQVDCVNMGKSYVRFCVDGPLEDLSSNSQEIKISFKIASPNGTVDACNMNAELNSEPLDIVELKTNWKKGSGRVYGRIKDIESRNLRLLFEPEYTFDGEVSVYPFLEVCLEVGGKTLVANVHSFHFKELVDGSALKCIESMKKLNALLLKKKDLDIVKREFETLKDDALLVENTVKDSILDFLVRPHVKSVGIVRIKINELATTQDEHQSNIDTVQNKINNLLKGLEVDINKEDVNVLTIGGTLKEGLNNKRRPLPAWSDSGQATAINILEKFKFFLHHKIEWVRFYYFQFCLWLVHLVALFDRGHLSNISMCLASNTCHTNRLPRIRIF